MSISESLKQWANTYLCEKSCQHLSGNECSFYKCKLKCYDKNSGRYFSCSKCQIDTYGNDFDEEYDKEYGAEDEE